MTTSKQRPISLVVVAAFLLCSPPVFIGALILLRARDHLDADTAKIFQAIVTAMQEQQAREAGVEN